MNTRKNDATSPSQRSSVVSPGHLQQKRQSAMSSSSSVAAAAGTSVCRYSDPESAAGRDDLEGKNEGTEEGDSKL